MTKLLLIRLARTEYLQDVLLALTTVGVRDPLIVEAVGGHNRLLTDVPIFSGLFAAHEQNEFHRLILAGIDDDAAVDRILQALSDGGIDWEGDALGILAVVPVDRWVGPTPRGR